MRSVDVKGADEAAVKRKDKPEFVRKKHMKYFWTEAERKRYHTSCCFEFQKGEFDGGHWKEDSLCLDAELFDKLNLYELLASAISEFDYYGPTKVTVDEWNTLFRKSQIECGDKASLLLELLPWVEDCFKTEKVFYILGI